MVEEPEVCKLIYEVAVIIQENFVAGICIKNVTLLCHSLVQQFVTQRLALYRSINFSPPLDNQKTRILY